jgi:hypothetical protein
VRVLRRIVAGILATVVVSGVFTAAAALCVLWLSLAWGYSRGAALFAATAYGVATPAWCYATLFMGHALCAGCLMIAFTAAVALRDAPPERAVKLAWTIGLSAGWAVVSEFPAAVPVLFICGLTVAVMSGAGRGLAATQTVAIRVAAGGAIAALILFAYNTAAFGSPFHLGYASEEGFEQLQTGLFGISRPELWRVREILIGGYRGLLPIAPLVAVMPIGLALLATAPPRVAPALAAAAVGLFYLVLNASYFYWEGGWAFGPRQMSRRAVSRGASAWRPSGAGGRPPAVLLPGACLGAARRRRVHDAAAAGRNQRPVSELMVSASVGRTAPQHAAVHGLSRRRERDLAARRSDRQLNLGMVMDPPAAPALSRSGSCGSPAPPLLVALPDPPDTQRGAAWRDGPGPRYLSRRAANQHRH